jgi:outer membrane protein
MKIKCTQFISTLIFWILLIFFHFFIQEFSFSQSTPNAQKLSLQDCINRAKTNSFQKKQTQSLIKISNNNLVIAQNERLPKISGNMVNYLNSGRSIDRYTNLYTEETIANQAYGIDVGLPIYQGGQITNNIKINQIATNLLENDIKNKELNLTIEVITAFFSVVNLEEQVKISEQQIEVSYQQLNRLETLRKEGLSSRINILTIKSQLANDQMQKVNTDNDLALAKTKLLQTMNESSNFNFQTDRKSIEINSAEMYKMPISSILGSILQNHPALKKFKGQLEISKLNTEITKASLKPTISLGFSLGANYSTAAPKQIFVYDGKTKIQETVSNDYVLLNGKKNYLINTDEIATGAYSKVGYFDQLSNNFNKILYLNLKVPLYDAGITKKRIENTLINKEISNIQLNETETKIRQAVELAYLDKETSYKRLEASKNQVEIFNESFILIQKQFEEGIINSTEYILVKSQLDKVKQNQVQYMYDYILRTKILDFYISNVVK